MAITYLSTKQLSYIYNHIANIIYAHLCKLGYIKIKIYSLSCFQKNAQFHNLLLICLSLSFIKLKKVKRRK